MGENSGNVLEIPDWVEALAEAFMECYIERTDTVESWPDDRWISLGRVYDLNLWKDDRELGATVYKVVYGIADTSKWKRVYSFRFASAEENQAIEDYLELVTFATDEGSTAMARHIYNVRILRELLRKAEKANII